jgi:type II secretion system (T2SS) protein F
MTGRVDSLVAACGLAVALRYPWLAAAFVLPILTRRYRSYSIRRAEKRRADSDAIVVGRVLQIALAGGLPLTAGLGLAVEEVGEVVAAELTATLRAARRGGMAAALAGSGGACMRQLFSRIALAQASGAPMQEAVGAYLADGRARRRGLALERVRRLPVTLMVPLGLLILPGFVVLFVGPIVLNSVMDLSGSLP